MSTRLVSVREPTRAEKKRGAEIVFCYESWEQWGAATEVLSENVDAVERWRRQGLEGDES